MRFRNAGPAFYAVRAGVSASRISAKYGDPIPGFETSRPNGWDCSWFVAEVFRDITGLKDLFRGPGLQYATTAGLMARSGTKSYGFRKAVPLLWILDGQSTTYIQKTVHVGIAIPGSSFSKLGRTRTCEALADIEVLDLFEGSTSKPWFHRASEWFKTTPLSQVSWVSFPGASAPDIPLGFRFGVTAGYIDLYTLARDATLREAV